jgi:preprotein translocase subunit SecG
MLLLILNVVYVLLAISMVALILMQRGAGAQAGSGFGGGASGTVFGSRGASNFMSKSTKWLAITFFAISMFMAWYATHSSAPGPAKQDLGVMAQVPAASTKAPISNNTSVPIAPAQQPAPASTMPASTIPGAPAPQQPAATQTPSAPQPQSPAPPAPGG